MGEYEETFLSQGLAGIDFGVGYSAGGFNSRESLREHMPTRNSADQVWNFIHEIRVGDMIVLPRTYADQELGGPGVEFHPRNSRRRHDCATSKEPANVGRVSGDYQYREELEASHVRSVDWKTPDVPRSYFDRDLLNSMGGLATVFRVRANNAEARIDGILGKHLSGDTATDGETVSPVNEETEFQVDLEEQIYDRIVDRIRDRFSGTRMEYLVAEILRASGYRALETRPGPDGGVDVLAGQGDMGFGDPRLCVQVKSGRSAVDLPDYNRLQGNIGSFGAEHGLLVSLGDFTKAVRNENERSFFQIRLWGPNDLVDKLLETYDGLPDDVRREIPLRNRRILIETA